MAKYDSSTYLDPISDWISLGIYNQSGYWYGSRKYVCPVPYLYLKYALVIPSFFAVRS